MHNISYVDSVIVSYGHWLLFVMRGVFIPLPAQLLSCYQKKQRALVGVSDASSADDLEKFGFHAWQPPDAGQDTNPAHFGGGCADYDSRWANQAAAFLRSKEATSGQPFALIVSFVNPHDTLSYA